MRAIDFKESTHIYAANQPEYLPLPAYTKNGIVTSCYELTWKERLKVLVGAKIWVSLRTFNKPLQPQRLSIEKPF
jgi:hypothetical protein